MFVRIFAVALLLIGVAVFAASGIGHVVVRPSPRVVVVATGDELVDVGRRRPGRADAHGHLQRLGDHFLDHPLALGLGGEQEAADPQ